MTDILPKASDIMKRRRSWIWRLGMLLIILLVIGAVSLFAARQFLKTDAGARFAEQKIMQLAPAGQRISIQGLSGDLLSDLSLSKLTLSDAQGVWLRASDVTLDWAYLSLLRKELNIETLNIQSAEILRRPNLELEDTQTEPPAFLPIRYDLHSFNVSQLILSENAAPRRTALMMDGQMVWERGQGRLRLDARTAQGRAKDQIALDLEISTRELVTGTATIESQSDGIISSLLGLENQAPLSFDVTTNGSGAARQTDIAGRIGQDSFADGIIKGGAIKGGDAAQLQLNLLPNTLPILAGFSALFGGPVKITAALSENDALYVDASMTAPNVDAKITASQTNAGWDASRLTATLREPHTAFPDIPAKIESAAFNGRASFGETLQISGDLRASKLSYNGQSLDQLSGPITLSKRADEIKFNTQLLGTGKTLTQPARLAAQGAYNQSRKALSLTQADLSLMGARLQASGDASLIGQRAALSGSYALEKNAPLFPLPANVSGTFQSQGLNQAYGIELSGRADNIDELPAALLPLIGPRLTYAANIKFAEDGLITFPNIQLNGDNLSLSGTGQYDQDGNIEAAFDTAATDLALDVVSAPRLTATATISGRADNLQYDINADAPELTLQPNTDAQQIIEAVTLTATGTRIGSVMSAKVSAIGQHKDGPVTLKTQGRVENETWTLENLNADLAGLTVTGRAQGLGADMAALNTDVNITGNPKLFFPAEKIEMAAKIENNQVSIDAVLDTLSAGPLSDGQLRLTANGPRSAIRFNLSLEADTLMSEISRKLELSSAGTASLTDLDKSLTATLSGKLGRLPFEARAPIQASQTAQGWMLNAQMAALSGSLDMGITQTDSQMRAQVKGAELVLADILALAGRPGMEGLAGFDGDFTLSGQNLNGAFKGQLLKLKQPVSDLEPIDISVEGDVVQNQLTLFALSESELAKARMDLAGPMTVTQTAPYIVWPPETPLKGKADVTGRMGVFTELFLPPETDVTGTIDLDAEFAVPFDAQDLNGSISVSDGGFEQGFIGLSLNTITMAAEFNRERFNVNNFEAKGKSGGTLSGRGQMDLGFGEGSVLTLTANKIQVLNRREGKGKVSGDLKLSHNGKALQLGGLLRVDQARLNIDKFPRAGRPTLDVSFADNAETESEAPLAATKTALNISIESDGNIALAGYGVNANLALDAAVTGPFNAPVLEGNANITRGYFDFISKRFDFETGRVEFAPDLMQSLITVKAERSAEDVDAQVSVTGTLERPEITLSSESGLPDDEVLSRILFGRSPSQLSTFETARLAAALARLSGGSGFDLMGGLQNSLSLDTLAIGQNEAGGTQLTTGKYLSDNVYVEVESSVEGAPGLKVEWTPRQNVSIEAQTSSGDAQRLSVQWQKDFDSTKEIFGSKKKPAEQAPLFSD